MKKECTNSSQVWFTHKQQQQWWWCSLFMKNNFCPFWISGFGQNFFLLRSTSFGHHFNAGEHTGRPSPRLEGPLPGSHRQRTHGFHNTLGTWDANNAWTWNSGFRRIIISWTLTRPTTHTWRRSSSTSTLRSGVRSSRVCRQPCWKFGIVNARPVWHARHVRHVRSPNGHGPRPAT